MVTSIQVPPPIPELMVAEGYFPNFAIWEKFGRNPDVDAAEDL